MVCWLPIPYYLYGFLESETTYMYFDIGIYMIIFKKMPSCLRVNSHDAKFTNTHSALTLPMYSNSVNIAPEDVLSADRVRPVSVLVSATENS